MEKITKDKGYEIKALNLGDSRWHNTSRRESLGSLMINEFEE